MEKSVYIVILNWNGSQDTIECLESIQKLKYQNYKVILIENGSTDYSLDELSNWIIKNNFPKGFQVLCSNCNFAKGLKKNNNKCPMKNKPH